MTTLAGAFQQLSSIGSLEALTSLALELSANATAPNAVLYSNDLASGVSTSKIAPMIAHQLGWAVIDDTARAKFIFSDAFKTAAATLIENEVVASLGHADQVEIANRVTAFLYDPATSIAAQTSREFIASVEGKVLALTPNALANRIFAVDELPGVLP